MWMGISPPSLSRTLVGKLGGRRWTGCRWGGPRDVEGMLRPEDGCSQHHILRAWEEPRWSPRASSAGFHSLLREGAHLSWG